MSFWMGIMASRSWGRLETGNSSRPFSVSARLEAVHGSHVTRRKVGAAPGDAELGGVETQIGRELMRLECARQLIDGEIARLREVQRRKTS